MSRSVSAALFVLIVGAVAVPAAAQQAAVTSPTVSTEGRASQKVAPDQAWITVIAEARAPRTADAQKQNATAIESLKASLKQAGVADEAVKTRSYSMEPQMQYADGKSKVIGYMARHALEVRVDDLARLGAVIDAAGSSGATTISDIRCDVKARSAIETRLLGAAVKDGLERATIMATAAGKEILTVWRIDEQRFSNNVPQPMYRAMAGAAMDAMTSIAPNELEIQAHVSLTVMLK